MTLARLEAQITTGDWFTRCGQFPGGPDAVALAEVASADTWEWLPTARDQEDPIHGSRLITTADAGGLGQARREAELAAARWLRARLRDVPLSVAALVDGPHDFSPAARGGAEFAARMAARELVLGEPGFWCRVVQIFAAGYWPCGREHGGGRLVVW